MEENRPEFDPKISTLYQTCLRFLKDFGEAPPSVSRRRFSEILVGYYICIKEDHNLPLADDYLDLKQEYCEALDALQFVHAIAKYYYKKLNKTEVMPYG